MRAGREAFFAFEFAGLACRPRLPHVLGGCCTAPEFRLFLLYFWPSAAPAAASSSQAGGEARGKGVGVINGRRAGVRGYWRRRCRW